jgi:hypothetical protein
LNDYEQRRQNRIDRLHEKAEQARAQSNALSKQSHDMASAIPFGQPVHGAADQRYRDRIGKKMEQSIAAADKAAYYESRAQAAENNTAISSDDPEAIKKLTDKLESLREMQVTMKNINAYYRKYGTCQGAPGLRAEIAEKLDREVKEGPSWVTVPYAPYMLSNNNQEIHRIEARLKKLTEAQELGYTGWEFEGGRVEANQDINRLQIFFDDIPEADVRQELKSRGFRWARNEGAWQRQLTDNAIYSASRIKAIQPSDGSDPTKIQPKRTPKPPTR